MKIKADIHKEDEQTRKDRARHARHLTTKVIPDPTKYNRRRSKEELKREEVDAGSRTG